MCYLPCSDSAQENRSIQAYFIDHSVPRSIHSGLLHESRLKYSHEGIAALIVVDEMAQPAPYTSVTTKEDTNYRGIYAPHFNCHYAKHHLYFDTLEALEDNLHKTGLHSSLVCA